VHETPEQALSDGPNSYKIDDLPALLNDLIAIYHAINR